MSEALLKIHWWYGTEYVPISAKDTTAGSVTTLERWRGGISLMYIARLERFNLERNPIILYRPDNRRI